MDVLFSCQTGSTESLLPSRDCKEHHGTAICAVLQADLDLLYSFRPPCIDSDKHSHPERGSTLLELKRQTQSRLSCFLLHSAVAKASCIQLETAVPAVFPSLLCFGQRFSGAQLSPLAGIFWLLWIAWHEREGMYFNRFPLFGYGMLNTIVRY